MPARTQRFQRAGQVGHIIPVRFFPDGEGHRLPARLCKLGVGSPQRLPRVRRRGHDAPRFGGQIMRIKIAHIQSRLMNVPADVHRVRIVELHHPLKGNRLGPRPAGVQLFQVPDGCPLPIHPLQDAPVFLQLFVQLRPGKAQQLLVVRHVRAAHLLNAADGEPQLPVGEHLGNVHHIGHIVPAVVIRLFFHRKQVHGLPMAQF